VPFFQGVTVEASSPALIEKTRATTTDGSGQYRITNLVPGLYRGSTASVQTVEGMRPNNLCGSGQYSGNYWNDGKFREISYSTGVDSAEMVAEHVVCEAKPRRSSSARFSGPWLNEAALTQTGQQYGKGMNQLDLRAAKRFGIGGNRQFMIMADLYNVFNSDWVFSQNNTLGTKLQASRSLSGVARPMC
jgi:hypothetical protein